MCYIVIRCFRKLVNIYMDKKLLEFDIRQKLDKLDYQNRSNLGIFVMFGIVVIDLVLLTISILLKFFGSVSIFYSSTIPIFIFAIYNFIIGIKLNNLSKKSTQLKRNLAKEIAWLTDYEKLDSDRIYDQFIEISEVKLPPKRR